MSHNIFVVSFAPAFEDGGTGGFDWATDLSAAEERYRQYVTADQADPNPVHVVRLVEVQVSGDPQDREAVDAELTERSDEHEMTLPALAQFVPVGADYVPSGGIAS